MFDLLVKNPLKSILRDITDHLDLSTDWITPTASAMDNTIRGHPLGVGARTIWIREDTKWRPLEILALLAKNNIAAWGNSQWRGPYSIEVSEDDYNVAVQVLQQSGINFD